ncbi:MAG: TapB family protein [Luteolibacter sp.]
MNLGRCFLFGLVLMSMGGLEAETYHVVKVADLDFVEKGKELDVKLAETNFWNTNGRERTGLRSSAEAYLEPNPNDNDVREQYHQGALEIAFKLEDEAEVSGFLDLKLRKDHSNPDEPTMEAFEFRFQPGESTEVEEERFLEIRKRYALSMANGHLPGTAWFRHLAGVDEDGDGRRVVRSNLSDTFGIFGGGRAISENLALDRDLILGLGEEGKTIALSEIEGVTVDAIDWASRMPDEDVAVDVLSLAIPEDQHAVFASGLVDLLELTERFEKNLLPGAQAYSVRSPFRRMAGRYRSQMGLDAPAMAARLLPVESVAITGGDPFFPQGTDVSILMESDNPELLFHALVKTISVKAKAAGAVEVETISAEGRAFQNADRSFSSHMSRMGNLVVVANSAAQIKRLVEVHDARVPALGETDEFRFFRNRYPLGEEESAFVFFSDATIRRWAGPEVRIAASRRTRAVAALGELTSRKIDGEPLGDDFEPLLGKTEWKDGKVVSEKFGSLGFITPSSELDLVTVSEAEKNAYERWRNGYESGWAQVFDPIAIRLRNDAGSLDFDLSVEPLTVDSDYADILELCGNAKLGEVARWVPEESLFHAAMAIDTKSQAFKEHSNSITGFIPGLEVNPLAWMTGDVSLDLAKSIFWESAFESGFSRSYFSTPAVVRIGSGSRMRLAIFLASLKKMMQDSAPDSMKWETHGEGAEAYVSISENDGGMGEGIRIYYAATPTALIVSLNERALLKAMAREEEGFKKDEATTLPEARHLMMDSSPGFLAKLGGMFEGNDAAREIQRESWKAIPILNQWHRMFPGKDLLAGHLRLYGSDVFCPGGKGYRWSDESMTMESVAFGHPGEPRFEPLKMPGVMDFENVRTGLAFQDGGLRATVKFGKAPARIPTPSFASVAAENLELATAAELVSTRKGQVLTYKGSAPEGELSLVREITEVAKEGEATFITTAYEVTYPEQDPVKGVFRERLEGSLSLVADEDTDSGDTYSKPSLQLPDKLVEGATTRSRFESKFVYSDEGKKVEKPHIGDIGIRVLGKEDVTVPGGTFAGTIKIETVTESLYDGEYGLTKFIHWYHPDVGMVKYEDIYRGESMELIKIEEPPAEQ